MAEEIGDIRHKDFFRVLRERAELLEALQGMIVLAECAMPDTYLATDSRVIAARTAINNAIGEA